MGKMKFILHWYSSPDEIVEGDDIAQAMTLAGYSQGALPALDYWEEIKEDTK